MLHMPDRPTHGRFVMVDTFPATTQWVVSADSTGGYPQSHFEIRDRPRRNARQDGLGALGIEEWKEVAE